MDNDDTKNHLSKEVWMSPSPKRLTRKVFEHHSNPWSAWTRLLRTPLVLVPFWTRSPRHAALIGARLLLNPVVFPEPRNDPSWATRAMLGEEMWIAKRPVDGAMSVNALASAFGIGGVVGALKRRPLPTALCTMSEVALLPFYWRLVAEYYEEHRKDRGRSPRRDPGEHGGVQITQLDYLPTPKNLLTKGGHGI
jgi:hypothetical protein